MTIDQILQAIGSTEPATFSEFCSSLQDCPVKGDREGWREVFNLLNEGERNGLIKIDRVGKSIDTLLLTEQGADQVRGKFDDRRELFQQFN
jgi:hypothetical protein